MRIGVGSTNPVKRDATEAALAGVPASAADSVAVESVAVESVAVESIAVESGVSEQPFGERETVTGARNRAENVLDAGEYDLGVGLEGGVAEVEGADGLFLVMWAAVADGERTGLGGGPQLRLPESVAERIREGEELGPVMDDVLDMDDVAKKQGAAGALTAGVIDREGALESALAGALGPFVTELYE
ncbi:inosine/xanthosine triphosphatase [Halorussus salilacus]|uniref:inosine/xanthosine triphosphatase n=1 Tax=Halorussus salilacus TaxID=2953750 RepID=UPI00209FFDBC|nr:inosine/xanthosine triphosphatase [Halorussus salilacus]USZ69134.1 inosine/xanthosine triphosphatase [Halorussus salilacus]